MNKTKIDWCDKPKTISSHGYIKIKFPEHKNADAGGYVYEHRLVAEKFLGRLLKSSEIVHHINGNKQDNSPSNLIVEKSIANHKVEHRKRTDLKNPDEDNPIILCACGCGNSLNKYDNHNRPRKYCTGHGKKGKLSYNPHEKIYCACGCGTVINKHDKYGRERKFISGHNTNIFNPRKRCL